MFNKKIILILTIILVSLLAVSAVSAADNATDDAVGMEETTDDAISVDEVDEVVSAEDNQVTLGNESDVGTFDELSSLIENTSEGGTLELDKDYKYVNGSTEGIQINKAITIDGKGHTLDGNHLSRIFMIYGTNVILKNLTFIKGFQSSGGAIYVNGKECNIINCIFENNTIENKISIAQGGAIHVISANCKIINSTFNNNIAKNGRQQGVGAAIYISMSDNFQLINSSFINNTAEDRSSAIEIWYSDNSIIDGCIFINNSAGGCTIHVYESEFNAILNSLFSNNTAKYAISTIGASKWYNGLIDNCTFINNTAELTNVWFGSDSSGIINNSYFLPDYNNIMFEGDNIDINIIKRNSSIVCADVSLYYGEVSNFSSLLRGNDILFNQKVNFYLRNNNDLKIFSVITDNKGFASLNYELSELNAGIWSVTVIFEGNDNYAPCNATATVTVLPASSSLTIGDLNTTWDQGTSFIAKVVSDNNKTVDEGTVSFYIDDKFIGDASVINGTATLTHEAPGDAGNYILSAIYNGSNYLSSNGTAKMFVDTGDIEVEDYNYIATFKALAELIENAPEGTVLNLTKDYIYVSGSTEGIFINKEITIDGKGHALNGNQLSRILKILYGNVILKNINFINGFTNKNLNGGACLVQNSIVNFENCNFSNNMVKNNGGACYVSDCTTNFNNCNFVNNSASGAGAILWTSNSGFIKNCNFINNHDKSYGAIWVYDDFDEISNCFFDNNMLNDEIRSIGFYQCNGNLINCNFTSDFNNIYINDANINIVKKQSNMLCNNYEFYYNEISQVLIHVYDSKINLVNKNIVLNLFKNTISMKFDKKSDSEGHIILLDEILNLNVGIWNVTVVFEGDDNYDPCNATATITVLPPSTSLTIEDVNTTVGHEIALVANVSSDLIIDEGIVIFYDGDSIIGESNVNNGVATLTYTPTTAGEHNVTAIFSSDNYLSSNSTAKLLVDSATVKVLVDHGTVGFNSTFVAEVNGLYSTINEGNVRFYVDNGLIGIVPVVNGSASINYMPLNAKTYTVKAVFGDSDKFLNDENSTLYTVLPADSSISIGDMNGTVGHNLVITVGITSSNNLTINEGCVVFFDGSTQIGESNVINGIATLIYTPSTAGEHAITAMFYSTNYGDPINSALLNVSKANIDLSINNIATVYFSNPSAFNVNVYSNSKGVNEGNIKYYINGNYIGMSNVYGGQTSTDYATNTAGSFELLVVYNETDNYYAKTASTTFYVNKMPTTLTGESVIFDEQQSKTFKTELKDNNNNGVNGQTVKIEVIKYSGESATFTGLSDGNGIAVYDVGNLAGGMWYVAGTYNGNNEYIGSNFADKFIVVRMDTTTAIEEISNPYVNHTYKLKANIHDENGKLVKEGIVQFYLDGVDIGSIDLSKNQGHQSALREGVLGAVNPMFEDVLGANDNTDLYIDYVPTKAGKHTLTAVYGGTTIYKASNQTTTFNVQGGVMPTTITASDVNTVYNGGEYLVATLNDISKQPVGGVIVSIKLSNGKVYSNFKTDSKGQVKISTNGLAPKAYTAIITFAGNTNFAKSTKSVKITVKKATPKLTAKAKTFKKSVKTKKYSITLKTNQNKVMKNIKLTLKVNGKTYKATTNTKGQATFKITKLTKKGKYAAVVKFAGNKYYNAKTVKPKITVK